MDPALNVQLGNKRRVTMWCSKSRPIPGDQNRQQTTLLQLTQLWSLSSSRHYLELGTLLFSLRTHFLSVTTQGGRIDLFSGEMNNKKELYLDMMKSMICSLEPLYRLLRPSTITMDRDRQDWSEILKIAGGPKWYWKRTSYSTLKKWKNVTCRKGNRQYSEEYYHRLSFFTNSVTRKFLFKILSWEHTRRS